MSEQLSVDRLPGTATTRPEWVVRLDGRLLGHVVRDPDAQRETWVWRADGGGVLPQHEETREMAVYRLLVRVGGLDFARARTLVLRGEPLVAA